MEDPPPEEQAPLPTGSKLPDDPIETGPCALELALYDADSGAALKGKIHLYRLDAPGNEDWTRGDRLQAVITVPVEGATILNLPAGQYRPHCITQRYPGFDLAPLEVSGSLTRCAMRVAMPRISAAWLIVHDETSRAIEEGTLRGHRRTQSSRSLNPAWLQERKLREPDRYIRIGGGWGSGRGGSRRRRAVAEDGRYQLGRYAEDIWDRHVKVGWTWGAQGRTEVYARLDLERWTEKTFVGVSVPLNWVHDSVLMPDGGFAIDAGAKIRTWCPAVTDDTEPVIKVLVELKGYEKLSFEFAANDWIPARTLVAKRTDEAADR